VLPIFIKIEFWIVCMFTYTKGWLLQDLNPLMSIYRTEIVSYFIKDFKWYNTGHTWRFEHDNLRGEKCCAITENKNTVHQRPQNDFHIIFDICTFYTENGGSRFLQTSLLTYQIIWCHISNDRNFAQAIQQQLIS